MINVELTSYLLQTNSSLMESCETLKSCSNPIQFSNVLKEKKLFKINVVFVFCFVSIYAFWLYILKKKKKNSNINHFSGFYVIKIINSSPVLFLIHSRIKNFSWNKSTLCDFLQSTYNFVMWQFKWDVQKIIKNSIISARLTWKPLNPCCLMRGNVFLL